jgi:DNA repair protein RadD
MPTTNATTPPGAQESDLNDSHPPILRPYQIDALAELWRFWRAGGGNPLIDIATGLGKSFLIAELGRRFCKHQRRIVILSHVREIIEQDAKAILALWPEAPIGINCAALGARCVDAPIVIGSVQSIYREPQALGPRDLLIVDEAHLIPRRDNAMYGATIAGLRGLKSSMRVCGLTATAYRLDTGRLDEGEDRLFDAVVYSYGIGQGIADGWLAPLVAKVTENEIDVSGVGRRGGEFIAGELEAAADHDALVEGAVAEIVAQGAGRRHLWLAFCCGVDHAFHVRDALRRHGVSCESIVGDTPADERGQIIEAFRAGQITCLTNCNCLTTGFDVAAIDLIAMLRPTCSPGLYVQMLGRGTRKADGKQNCLVLDFSKNIIRHGPVDMVTGEHDGGNRVKKCPNCATPTPIAARACPQCDYSWPEAPPSDEENSCVRVPRHDGRAATVSPLSADATTLTVFDVTVSEHFKPGRPPSLRVRFYTDEGTISDWLAFEHPAGTRRRNGAPWVGASRCRRRWMKRSTDKMRSQQSAPSLCSVTGIIGG